MKTLEHFEKQLREKDLDTLPHRALRLQKLDSFKIPLVPTLRVWDYAHEAKLSYINGCYRSCIFCSSNGIEQSFIHELIVASEDWEKTYWEIKTKKMTFGKIIREVEDRKIGPLTKFVQDAKWLRNVRNEIVAHATYIPEYLELKSRDQLIWANKIMFRDIRNLLQFFSPQRKKQVEMEKLTVRNSQGKKIGESECLKGFLSHPTRIEVAIYFDWWAFQYGLLNELALEAYERMSKIINGLYYNK